VTLLPPQLATALHVKYGDIWFDSCTLAYYLYTAMPQDRGMLYGKSLANESHS